MGSEMCIRDRNLTGGLVNRFQEKPTGWISGGFFVLEPEVIDRIESDMTSWEAAPLAGLAAEGKVAAYQHEGFWQAMDTLRDKNQLEELWVSGKPPWKVWT